jgi:PAS domain S-box-containing protein
MIFSAYKARARFVSSPYSNTVFVTEVLLVPKRSLIKESLPVVLPSLLAIALFVVAIFGVTIPALKQNVMEREKRTGRELTEVATDILRYYGRKGKDGIMSKYAAQQEAVALIQSLRYGAEDKDYFWINDQTPRMVMHPYRPDLDGQDLTDYADPQGTRLFVEMVKTVKANGSGFVPYMWQWKDDPDRVTPKLSFVKLYEPWGWIVGTGIYLEDLERLVGHITRRLTYISLVILVLVIILSTYIVRQNIKALIEQRQAEAALLEQRNRAQTYLDTAQVMLLALDHDGAVDLINASGLKLLGYTESDLKGRNWFDVCLPEDIRPRAKEMFDRSLEGDENLPKDIEFPVLTKSGDQRTIKWRNAPLFDADGKMTGIIGSGEDVTEQRAAEEALKEVTRKREELELIVSQSPAVAFRWCNEPGWPVDFVSDNISQFGYQPDDFKDGSLLFESLVHPDDLDRIGNEVETYTKEGRRSFQQEYRLVTSEGQIRWVDDHTWVYRDSDGKIVSYQGVLLDITARKRAEEERTRLAAAMEQAAEAIVITDKEGRVQYVNPAFQPIGGEPDQVLGHYLRDLAEKQQPSELYKQLFKATKGKTVWTGRSRGHRPDKELYDIETTVSPIRDSADQITGFVAVARDITREVELENQLRQAQKMEAIGTLAGGIAHDFNNILASVIGYAELARRNLPDGSQAVSDLDEVLEAADRAKELVKQILTFSRQGDQEWRALKLVPVIKEALKLLRPSIPSTIEIRSRFDVKNDAVVADPTQIHQVLMNLCANAAHSMREKGGLLEVELDTVVLGVEDLSPLPEVAAGNYLRLRVRDTGHGMTTEVMARIFEPFYTTKGRGEGTGMGLSVAHGIVKSHGGSITVESAPDEGTAFTIYLPLYEGEISLDSKQTGAIPGGTERILLVDDEEALVDLWTRLLGKLGYRITATANSLEALQLIREDTEGYDLVITDHTMPRMTGLDLARHIRLINENLPIILCTGAADVVTGDKVKELGLNELVIKPVKLTAMAEAIRQALKEDS